MVVVLIIAILIAIAIPQFLGARGRAQDSAAKSDLRNALTAEKTLFTDKQTYLDTNLATTVADLQGIEPSLKWQTAAGPTVSVGDVVAGDGNVVCTTEPSKSGTTFSIAGCRDGCECRHLLQQGCLLDGGCDRRRLDRLVSRQANDACIGARDQVPGPVRVAQRVHRDRCSQTP